MTNDCSVSSFETDALSFSSSATCSKKGHVLRFENVLCWLGGSIDKNVFRLSGQRCVVDLHFVRLVDDDIARDVLSTFDDNDVTWDNIFGIDGDLISLSNDSGLRRDKVFKLSHHLSRLGCLGIREATCKPGDDSKHNT